MKGKTLLSIFTMCFLEWYRICILRSLWVITVLYQTYVTAFNCSLQLFFIYYYAISVSFLL